MNDVTREQDLEFEVDVMAQRIKGLWGVLGTLILIVVALIVSNVFLIHRNGRAQDRLAHAEAVIDSLHAGQVRGVEESGRMSARIAALAGLDETLRTRASAAAVTALRARVAELDERVTFGEERIDAIAGTARGFSAGLAAVNDSLAFLRRHDTSRERLAALEASAGADRARMAALESEIEGLRASQHRNRWIGAASDALGLVNFGIIVPHVLDHSGRP